MRAEEAGHRDRLLVMYQERFGNHISPIRREDVRGFLQRRPVWMMRPLGVKVARRQAEVMEMEATRFYQRAASRTTDLPMRELLNHLADEERKHTQAASSYGEKHLTETAKSEEAESHKRLFMLQFVQPGLNAQKLGRFSGRTCRQSWRRYIHGIRRIAFRRWLADWSRFTVDPRHCDRIDDHCGRPRSHAPLPDQGFPFGHGHCGLRGGH
jgi:rubrerythrin